MGRDFGGPHSIRYYRAFLQKGYYYLKLENCWQIDFKRIAMKDFLKSVKKNKNGYTHLASNILGADSFSINDTANIQIIEMYI